MNAASLSSSSSAFGSDTRTDLFFIGLAAGAAEEQQELSDDVVVGTALAAGYTEAARALDGLGAEATGFDADDDEQEDEEHEEEEQEEEELEDGLAGRGLEGAAAALED